MTRRPVKRPRERREKPSKRERLPLRVTRARQHLIKPDPDKPHVVRLFVSPTREHMRATVYMKEGDWAACAKTAGMVRSYTSLTNGRNVIRPGHIIASMYLNVADMHCNGGEIISHECTHAGMAWARLRHANLARMVGEEVLCYAVGRMTKQVIRIAHMSGAWK